MNSGQEHEEIRILKGAYFQGHFKRATLMAPRPLHVEE